MSRPAPRAAVPGAALLVALTGCASLPPARMALPPELRSGVVETPMTGIGGGQRGRYALGPWRGDFERSATRLSFFDVLENRKGSTRYTVAGPGIDGTIAADCRMRERIVTIKVVTFTPAPLAYRCDFDASGQAMAARFELQQGGGPGAAAVNRAERRGELALPRVVLQMRSVHAVEGSPLALSTPLGYLLERDGTVVGAVEVNGSPRVLWRNDAEVELQRAIVVAAVALGVFWDPAVVGGSTE